MTPFIVRAFIIAFIATISPATSCAFTFDDGMALIKERDVIDVPIVVHTNPAAIACPHAMSCCDMSIDAQVERAKHYYKPYGINPVLIDVVEDDEYNVILVSDDITSELLSIVVMTYIDDAVQRALHVYVAQSIYDLDDDVLYSGLYFRAINPCAAIIILNTCASETVLAHELGHALGLEHDLDATNVMYPNELPGVVDELTWAQGVIAYDVAVVLSTFCWKSYL